MITKGQTLDSYQIGLYLFFVIAPIVLIYRLKTAEFEIKWIIN
jgi:hypothetical protein